MTITKLTFNFSFSFLFYSLLIHRMLWDNEYNNFSYKHDMMHLIEYVVFVENQHICPKSHGPNFDHSLALKKICH